MNYSDALEYINALKKGGMKWGLDRIRRALRQCGSPELGLRFVHVAGTNGKGSTARMIQSILTAAGYRTGLYLSPAITGYRGTITIDNTAIPKQDFAGIAGSLAALLSHTDDTERLSEFEFTTALALLYFAGEKADICVIECGLGGKEDATNVIPAPLAAVLTPVSLDHTGILGSSISQIAAAKCGIIKPPCAVVSSPEQNHDALAVILKTAAENGLAVRIPSKSAARIKKLMFGVTQFEYDDMLITLPLTGGFQIGNTLTAVEAVRSLEKHGFQVSRRQITEGLNRTAIPCRQEVLRRSPLIMVDGAHNPQGIAALADTLNRHRIKGLTLVMGMLADKDVFECIRLLAPFCAKVICCTPEPPRALPALKLAEIVKKAAPFEVMVVDSPASAIKTALKQPETPILAAGSFYTASAVRQALLKNNEFMN